MQILDPAHPIGAEQQALGANTGHPAEVIDWGGVNRCRGEAASGVHIGLGTLEALPGKAGSAIEQDIVGREPTQAPASGAEIFHAVSKFKSFRTATAKVEQGCR